MRAALIAAAVLVAAAAQTQLARPQPINQSPDPLLAPYRFRSIGPASMGGRIDDIAVAESDPSVIYVGYATGGVFKSVNNGTTFEPIFETYPTASVGDIAVHPTNPDILYVGTGEANNRQTSSFGDGVYKSSDGGRTFQHVGLRDTQTIARIVIDPRAPETVYVAATGHLFGSNKERGIYKTIDGGRTWDLVKFVDEDTGFTDVVLDPANSRIVYAASYQRRRSGCCFNGGGPGSAIWKSVDAGRTWTKLTAGLPTGTSGRIALDVSRSNPNVVFALIETGPVGQALTTAGSDPSAATESTPGGAAAAPGPGGFAYNWCNNAGPDRGFGRGRIAGEPIPSPDPTRSGLYRSGDKGASWTIVSNCNPRPMYFSQVRVDPANERVVYVAGLPVYKSLDGGRTFTSLDETGGHNSPSHVDQHAIWIDPGNPRHLIIGNDGGLNVSWDQGRTWDFVNTMATSQAYWVSADMRRPYYVYTGLQDNGSWGGPSATRSSTGILNSDWFGISGGDGFQTAVDPTDFNIVYTELQDGNASRYDLRSGRVQNIRPRATARGAAAPANVLNAGPGDQYRFNWNTPFQLSPHNPGIVWLGGNRLFRSQDRGNSWIASADVTKQVDRNAVTTMGVPGNRTMLSKNDGVVAYSTIVSLAESPIVPGLVWIGTDDGTLQVTGDGGRSFTNLSGGLPGLPRDHHYWISRIAASHHDAATAYVAVDGHRSDDLRPYIFATGDGGKSWRNIASTLPPHGFVQVVREDPRNPDLLYAGTEFGLYVSLDRGGQWQRFSNNLPTVRVDDILIHPRDGDLIVATHGRGIWIADDITSLQQTTTAVREQDVVLFDMRPAVAWLTDRQRAQHTGGQRFFAGENPPRGVAISFYLKQAAVEPVRITIADVTGRILRTLEAPGSAGVNRVMWDLTALGGRGFGAGRGGTSVAPGTYLVTLAVGGQSISKPVTVLEDVWMREM